jgi:hypothetical protein
MKPLSISALLLIGLSLILVACVPVGSGQNQISQAYIQTAVAMTLEAELAEATARAAGAALSYTQTPNGADGTSEVGEGTPDGETTPDPQDTLEPEPTLENPWMLQSWCVDHSDGCVKYDINNRTDSWLQIELRESDTGVTGFFSVRSKTYAQITLIPGQYQIKYTWWCNGDAKGLSEVKSLGSYIDNFKCPQGFTGRQNKN